MSAQTKPAVTGDMIIAQLVDEYPELVPVLIDLGMNCVGCPAAQEENLRDAIEGHMMDPDEVLAKLNAKLAEG